MKGKKVSFPQFSTTSSHCVLSEMLKWGILLPRQGRGTLIRTQNTKEISSDWFA